MLDLDKLLERRQWLVDTYLDRDIRALITEVRHLQLQQQLDKATITDLWRLANDRNDIINKMAARNAEMLGVLDKLWADKDAQQDDIAARRRLYCAWLDLRDVRNKAHQEAL